MGRENVTSVGLVKINVSDFHLKEQSQQRANEAHLMSVVDRVVETEN